MRGSHNIVGSEAIYDPSRRLVEFCHVHGSIHILPRRTRRSAVLVAFVAGAAVTLAALAFLLSRT